MALPPPSTFKQDMPPTGGFPKPPGFPVAGYRKRGPSRGPAGYIAVAGAVGLTVYGMVRFLYDVEDRNYYNLARFNQKFERAYVEQARENARWVRAQKALLDKERELMRDVPGWVVGQRRFYTQWEDRPDTDHLDLRKMGPW